MERKQKRRLSVPERLVPLIYLLILAGGIGLGVIWYGDSQFNAPGPLAEPRTVDIVRGSGTSRIAGILQREGVISNAVIFQAGVIAANAQSRLRAGEYRFEAGISMKAVMDKLVSGKVTIYKITIPEGLTSLQVVARVMAHPDLVGDVAAVPPEGSLLPQTYTFHRGEKRSTVLERMRSAQKSLVERLWSGRSEDLPVTTPDEVLILASIVERETNVASERRHVASVFVNRLRRGMRLQSDPTIIYGIVGGRGKLGRPILRSEIDAKTPYNTYQIDGLPPTPIANPGEASIAAVLDPLQTDDLYFVADGSGGHAFSRTLAEHNEKVRVWRSIVRQRRAREAGIPAADEDGADTGTRERSVAPGVSPLPSAEVPSSEPTTPSPSTGENTATVAAGGTERESADVPVPRPKPNAEPDQ